MSRHSDARGANPRHDRQGALRPWRLYQRLRPRGPRAPRRGDSPLACRWY